MSDEIVPNPYADTGILPGTGWNPDLLNSEEGELILNYVRPISEDGLTQGAIDQAVNQWRYLFPEADERDRTYFMAGVSAMLLWWSYASLTTYESHADMMADAPEGYVLMVPLHEVDEFVGMQATRLITILFNMDDDAAADLDDAFSDVIEGLDHE